MGIYKLMSLLQDKAPKCIKQVDLSTLMGKYIACDASMAIYQFLISTQSATNQNIQQLKDSKGNLTGHLLGLFNRSLMFIDNGIKPIWIFDGKPPELKADELSRRIKIKEQAAKQSEEALIAGDIYKAFKMHQRTTTITTQIKEDTQKMFQLMGLPFIVAPGEAEAQCAAMGQQGKVYATATEDMDALTFQTPILLRGFNSKREPIIQITYNSMIKELQLSDHAQFVDLCILCGCDYAGTISFVGPTTAYKLIKEHKSIENIIIALEKKNQDGKRKRKYQIPENFNYQQARDIFNKPLIKDPNQIEIKWTNPEDKKLVEYLCNEKGFSQVRVENGIKKLNKHIEQINNEQNKSDKKQIKKN